MYLYWIEHEYEQVIFKKFEDCNHMTLFKKSLIACHVTKSHYQVKVEI